MVNWKKWFLEEDEEEVFREEEEKVEKSSKKENKKVDKYTDYADDEEFDIEYSHKKEKVKKEIEEDYVDYDLEVEDVSSEFDIEFDDEEDEFSEDKSAKEVGVFSKIKDLFKSRKKDNKVEDSVEEEDNYEEELFEEEDDEAEDYKTYFERQKRERQERNTELYDSEEEKPKEEKGAGFFSKLKDKFFSVSDEEIEQEELDRSLDEYYEDEEEEELFVKENTNKHQEDDELVIEYQDDYFEEEYKGFEEIDLEEFEEKETKETTEEVAPDLATTLKKLGVENAEIKDVDIFGDKSGRRTHPTLAAVRTKRLKQDHKIDDLEKEVILGRDNTALKEEVASVYRERQKEQEEIEERESRHKEERQKLDSEFNKPERKEDKIEKDNPLYQQNKELDDIFENIEQKENQAKIKEVPEFEVREVKSGAERRERVKYTSVNDILGGNEELFEDDIDRTTRKTSVESRNKEEVEEVETTTNYKDTDLSDEKENVTLDELIESENIEIGDEKDETTKEIEELNSNLEEIKQEKEKLENLEEKEEDEVDLVEEVAKIEDIEVEEYDEIKEPKKDRLEGYSDYHLDEGEIVELEEQNYLEENTDNVNIDSLLKDITANKKQQLHVANDVDKFTEEKTVPYEVVEKRQEAVRERSNTTEEEVKPVQKVEEVEPVTQTEEVEETTGIEYTEKLYTEDVYSYFDSDKGNALGEYKTIDRGYRPVSKEKIEKNQKILDAIFEKYSTSTVNVPKKSVVNTMMETSTITPNSRSVGKFKPSPVYSSVYGSVSKPSPKKEESKKTTKNTKTNSNIYKEIASQEEAVWNIGTSKRVPKNKVKNKKTRK